MWQQQSFQQSTKSALYLVPTPIGNLEDMTYRAINILKEADMIAAEDTRQTKKLCHVYEITTPIVSYHEHNKEASGAKLIDALQSGKTVALVSDAGMPTISDPGYELVAAALEEKLPVIPLPGANAALTALIASGIKPQPFYFFGFLGRGKKERREQLEKLQRQSAALIFYEAPHRLKETLTDIEKIFGNRNIVLSRELTKKFEEFIRGTVVEAIEWAKTNEIRGEFCLIVEGNRTDNALEEETEKPWWEPLTLVGHVTHYIEEEGLSSKQAIKKTAEDRKLPKREVYQAYHVEE